MIRFTLLTGFALLFWVSYVSAGTIQPPLRLPLNPERIQYAREVEATALRQDDSLQLAEAYYLYGKTYVFAGDYLTAQAYFLRSLRILEPRGDSFKLSRLYVRLFENEEKLGHRQKARQYVDQALRVAQRIHSDSALIRAYSAQGKFLESIWTDKLIERDPLFRQTLWYYQQQERLCNKLKDTMGIAESNCNQGALLNRIRDRRAIPYLEKALHLFTRQDKNGIRVKTMLHLATAYLYIGQTGPAYQMLQAADRFYTAQKLNEYDIRVAMAQNYVLFYQTTGQWEQAFTYLQTLKELTINQLLADQEGVVARLNVEYETEKHQSLLRSRELELQLNNQHLATQQWLTLAVSALFLIAAGIGLVFFRLNRRNRRISRWNAELVNEQNHRVKNNLQVVSSLLRLQARRLSDEAARKAVEESRLRVESMAILHRRLYSSNKLAAVALHDFFPELIGSILQTYGCTTVQTQFTIEPVPVSADKAVPLGLILNELTTNACKYAFPYAESPRFIVNCRLEAAKLMLTVADNGPLPAGVLTDWLHLDRPGKPGIIRTAGVLPSRSFPDGSQLGPVVAEANVTTTLTDLPTAPARNGFGLTLIQSQVSQLRGTARFDADPAGGLVFTLACKL